MDPRQHITIFLAEFDYQIEQIKSILKTIEKKSAVFKKRPIEREGVESTGFWLHNLYCAFEDLFKIVADFWENNLAVDGEYHIHLLKRMLLRINDVRPPLISQGSFRLLNELRGFRHVFRHAYSYGLDEDRVQALLRKIIDSKDVVIKDLNTFRKTVAGYVQD
jgi:uncharacterized protein YutE (UPF0331/DUF86 family)